MTITEQDKESRFNFWLRVATCILMAAAVVKTLYDNFP